MKFHSPLTALRGPDDLPFGAGLLTQVGPSQKDGDREETVTLVETSTNTIIREMRQTDYDERAKKD